MASACLSLSSPSRRRLGTLLFVATAAADPITSVVVGDVRVTALSASLIRVEPRGPTGFEDRSTFNVVGRDSFSGLAISVKNSSGTGAWLATSAYLVHLPISSQPRRCAPQVGMDAMSPVRHPKFKAGATAQDSASCCALCLAESDCVAWTFRTTAAPGINCWPFSAVAGSKANVGRTFGFVKPTINVTVTTPEGRVLWQGANVINSSVPPNELHWPAPRAAAAYAFEDRPRFHVPAWGPSPIPADVTVDPALVPTNGYDFRNEVDGDTYIFLLGDDLASWWQSRGDFLTLTGPTPLLPDVAYGVWYTWYIRYTEQRAKDEILNWTAAKLPLDVWGLDMNWREIGVQDDPPTGVSECRSQKNDDPA